MKFNRNIYKRLYQIAFFMPDRIKEGDNYEITFELPHRDNVPIDDPNLRKRFWDILCFVTSKESGEDYKFVQQNMQIDVFEINCFLVCMHIYLAFLPFFNQYQESFKPRKKDTKCGIEDDPEGFFLSLPKDVISKDEIKERSCEIFSSLKSCSYFFCNFTPCYLLFKCASLINKYEKEIPMLSYTKKAISEYFCDYSIEPFSNIKSCLSFLYDSLEVYSKSKHAFNSLKDEELSFWNSYLEKIKDGVIMYCFDVFQYLSHEAGIPVFDYIFYEKPSLVKEKDKNKREKISAAHKLRLKNRTEQVRKHINIIKKTSVSKKISIKKACEEYLKNKKNKIRLQALNINSSRTLENLCGGKDPNKQRSDFANRVYVKPNYSTAFQKAIEDIFYNLQRSNRRKNSKKNL